MKYIYHLFPVEMKDRNEYFYFGYSFLCHPSISLIFMYYFYHWVTSASFKQRSWPANSVLTEKTVSYLKHLINLHLHWRNFSQLSKHNFNTFIFHLIYKERRKVNGLVWHKKVISAVILKASVRRNKLENWLGASPRAHYIT